MELTEREERKREAHRNLYAPLQEQPIDLDEIFQIMIDSIRYQYVGFERKKRAFTPTEYRTYILSHHRYNTLTMQMLVRSLHQFAADMNDRNLVFACDDWIDYRNTRPRFRVRAQRDCLWVTEAAPESGFVPGDRLLKLQRQTPEQIRRYMRRNSFYSREPERELWGGYLSMAASAEVEHPDGTRETLPIRQFPMAEEEYPIVFDCPAEGAVRLRLERLDREEIETIVSEHAAEIAGAEKLILDLRRCVGGEEEAAFPLLPYLIDRERSLEELLGEQGSYVNCTAANCELRYRVLAAFQERLSDPEEIALVEAEKQFYLTHHGRGLVYKPGAPVEERSFTPAARAPKQVVVLTDCFCEQEGERFVALCRRCGDKLRVIGRPTRGTLDCFDPITVALNEHMTLSYPIAMSVEAYEGRGIAETGLPVDEYLPWTPEEIAEDLLLKKALEK